MKKSKNENNKNNINDKKIFHLGFFRSGSLLLTNTLEIAEKKIAFNMIKTGKFCYSQPLGLIMYNNLNEKNKILLKDLKHYDGFFNLDYFFPENYFDFGHYFKEMESQYKGSQFIITIRPIIEYLLSFIYFCKNYGKSYFCKKIDNKKIIHLIDNYFNHCLNVREYFNLQHVKKRSELYIFIPGKITPEELLKKMKIPLYPNVKMNIKDYSEFNFDKEDYYLYINDKILKIIYEKIQTHGDPSNFDWWKI